MTQPYQADIAIHPGESLSDLLDYLHISQKEFAQRMGLSEKHVSQILNCKSPITFETALKLETVLGKPASYWNNLQQNYEETLLRIEREQKVANEAAYAKKFKCYQSLVEGGYVEKTSDFKKRAENLMRFLRVDSLLTPLKIDAVAFKKIRSLKVNEEAVICWLRAGEVEAEKVTVAEYNPTNFKNCLQSLRKLTLPGVENFWEKLQQQCADCGVALIYVPYFSNTKINSAFRWFRGRPLIQMTLLGAYSDIFWFAFFHEVGHVLLHGKKEKFLDSFDKDQVHFEFTSSIDNEEEKEANDFASEALISSQDYEEFLKGGALSHQSIKQFAEKIGIHPGIVAGRLAHDERTEITWPQIAPLRSKLTAKKTS